MVSGGAFITMDTLGLKLRSRDPERPVYLYFYNKKPKIKKSLSEIKSIMQDKLAKMLIDQRMNDAGLCELIFSENPVVDHLFYPEDIFFAYKKYKSEKLKNPIEALTLYMKGDSE